MDTKTCLLTIIYMFIMSVLMFTFGYEVATPNMFSDNGSYYIEYKDKTYKLVEVEKQYKITNKEIK